jgi:hypothetical protein
MMGASPAGGGVLVATPSVTQDTSLVRPMARAEMVQRGGLGLAGRFSLAGARAMLPRDASSTV